MTARVKLYFDGGWRPATGMEIAVVVRGETRITRDLGPGSSMAAEWIALIEALRTAQAMMLDDFVLLGDSRAVIDQATGRTTSRGENAHHRATFCALAAKMPRIRHIPRAQNFAGIALAALHPR